MSCSACDGTGYQKNRDGADGAGWFLCTLPACVEARRTKIFVDKPTAEAVEVSLVEPVSVLEDAFVSRRLRVLQQTSASQVELFRTCPRKWFYSYIEGRREEQSAAQAAGQDIDDNYVQPYLRGEELRSDGPWVEHLRALIPYLPEPGRAMVQHEFRIDTFVGGPQWLGYIDWVYQRGPDWLQADDLKSTSDFKYAKTREQLEQNLQMLSYAEALYREFEPAQVSIGHVVIRRKPPARVLATPGDGPPIFVTRQRAADYFGEAVEDVRAMVRVATSCASADDLEPNTAACSDYGGCFHRASCAGLISTQHLTKGFPKMAAPNGTGLSLAERLAKRNAGLAAAPTPPPAPAPAPAPAAPKPEPPPAAASPFTMQPALRVVSAPDAVVPPDAPPRTSTPEYVAEVEATAKKRGRPKKEQPPASTEAELEAARQAARADGPPPARVETPQAKIVEASKALKAELDAHVPQRAARKVPAIKPVLFVDCLPQKGATATPLEEWLAPIAEAAAAAYVDPKTGAQGVADWRLISYTSAAVLAVAIREALDTCPEALAIDSHQRGAEVALEELVPHAALVVRGIR